MDSGEPRPDPSWRPASPGWRAVLLGVLVPGLGQAYAGYPYRALIWFLGALGLGTLTIRAMLTGQRPPFNLVLPMLLLPAYYFLEIVDAARLTHRNRAAPSPYRWWVWAAIVVVFVFVVQPAVTAVFKRAGQGFVFTAESMAPTLLKYDYVMVNKTVATRERGEVIVFERAGASQPLVARVIGLPDDRVAVRDGRAIVNDVQLTEPYARIQGRSSHAFGPVVVPPGHLFVLGDNRNHANDSRYWGFLPAGGVVGRVNLVYFSQEPATGAIRWERIGQPVR